MTFTLPALPYEHNALEPYISAQTLGFHYDKHHAGYLTKLNAAIESQQLKFDSLEDLIQAMPSGPVFQNAGQVWNHTFYWNSMTPDMHKPSDKIAQLIDTNFGSFEDFKSAFVNKAMSTFGSGWVWLVQNNAKLELVSTSNADSPLSQGLGTSLFTCDVWEHAYYLDSQNDRAAYASKFLNLINWKFAESNLV